MKIRFRWQQVLRIVLAVVAIVFAGAVWFAIRERRPPAPGDARTPRTDLKAVAESRRGESVMARGTVQDFKVQYERMFSYDDGTLRFEKVNVAVPQRGGRDFTITGQRATVTNNQNDLNIEGDVQLRTSDGLLAKTETATYQSGDGILRAPGPVTFERERLKGSGVGTTYDRNRDILVLLKDAHIVLEADPATGTGLLDVTSAAATFARAERYMRFDGAAHLVRDQTVVDADTAVAHLAPDQDLLQLLELRGNSRVSTAAPQPGSLEAMTARDINLGYAQDGRSLQHATLAGTATTRIAGPAGQPGRRLSANYIEFGMGPDGTTLTSLAARERVDLEIPAESAQAASRRITSTSLEGSGEAGQGLTIVRFVDNVEFRETRPAEGNVAAVDRTARSKTLDTVMKPGLGGIDQAAFAGGVTFRDGTTNAAAPDAVYDLAKGTLRLTASPAGRATLVDDRANIVGNVIDLALDTNAINAEGDVRSVLKSGESGSSGPRKRPAMLRNDQPVNVTAKQLAYDSRGGSAVYTGDARLWQGETAIQGGVITLDDRQGNLTAKTNVKSTWRLDDTDPKTGKVEKKTTVATGQDFVYQDAVRRATYTTGARLVGPEGDLRATKIELYLKAEGNALERLEADDAVTLRSGARTSTGLHMTYFAQDARYVMNGTPVRVFEQLPAECRETVGRSLTFFRTTDTILVDGNEQDRTQTTSGGKCSAPPPAP